MAASASGPTSASEGVRTPPVSTTVRPGGRAAGSKRVGHPDRVGDHRDVRHADSVAARAAGRGAGAKASACRAGPAPRPPRPCACFSCCSRADFASKPGSSALLLGRYGTAVHLLQQPLPRQLLEVPADGHVRDLEQAGQVADPHAAVPPDLVEDPGLTLAREHHAPPLDRYGSVRRSSAAGPTRHTGIATSAARLTAASGPQRPAGRPGRPCRRSARRPAPRRG